MANDRLQFPDSLLEEIKDRIAVSDVVGRDIDLKRAGNEFECLSPFNIEDSPSFTVSDHKRFWHDFSADKHGDIFDWLVQRHGMSFRQAVEQLAREAGVDPIRVPRDPDRIKTQAEESFPGTRMNGKNHKKAEPDIETPRKLVATYYYVDEGGRLLYKVMRWEFFKNGKRKKTFSQHRMVDDGTYADSISAGFYRRSERGWRLLRGEEPQEGDIELDAVKHGLYKLPELNESMTLGHAVVLAEGEKDVETLWSIGIPATTNSGGSTNWRPDHNQAFKDADVIVAVHNDDPGRKWGNEIVDGLFEVAKRVRVLDISKHWPDCPKGGDVTDWVQQAGGTAEQLHEIIAKLPPVRRPLLSELGFVLWGDIENQAEDQHQELVQDWLTAGEVAVLAGPSQSGKSFFAIEIAMAIARGIPFLGKHPTLKGLVLYQAGEGARGIRFMRLPAYRIDKGLTRDDPVPIAVLPKPIDLHNNGDVVVEALIRDAKAAERATGERARLLIIDTVSTATPGADENSAKDISPVLDRCARLTREIGCAVLLITHLNAQATKIRGWTGFVANVETTFICREIDGTFDALGRQVREVQVQKQKDGERGRTFQFVLRGVQVGLKPDGSPHYSCVIDEPATGSDREAASMPPIDRMKIPDKCMLYFNAIQEALQRYGQPAPKELGQLSASTRVVHKNYVRDLFTAKCPFEASNEDARQAAIRQARKLHGTRLQNLGAIGVHDPWIWLTGRKVGTNRVEPDVPVKTGFHGSVKSLQDIDLEKEPF
jgi:hypothetical protein